MRERMTALLSVRIPAPMAGAILAVSVRCRMAGSAVVREILTEGLRARGEWPPQKGADDGR